MIPAETDEPLTVPIQDPVATGITERVRAR